MQVKTPVQEIMVLRDFINNLSIHQSPVGASPTLAEQMGKRVRVDAAQTFTVVEQAQGCANLGIGDPDTDFVAVYNTAKAQQ